LVINIGNAGSLFGGVGGSDSNLRAIRQRSRQGTREEAVASSRDAAEVAATESFRKKAVTRGLCVGGRASAASGNETGSS
jgi:hypothetical protein